MPLSRGLVSTRQIPGIKPQVASPHWEHFVSWPITKQTAIFKMLRVLILEAPETAWKELRLWSRRGVRSQGVSCHPLKSVSSSVKGY